jgi:hypothetical protein
MELMCQSGLHKWTGCKCSICGKVRDEDHDWSKDCEKCTNCGKTRPSYYHNWDEDCEKCEKCGKTREHAHNWTMGCMCYGCGKTRDSEHTWKGCNCEVCGKIRDEGHDWTNDCEKCANCGTIRSYSHDWIGWKCKNCNRIDTTHVDAPLLSQHRISQIAGMWKRLSYPKKGFEGGWDPWRFDIYVDKGVFVITHRIIFDGYTCDENMRDAKLSGDGLDRLSFSFPKKNYYEDNVVAELVMGSPFCFYGFIHNYDLKGNLKRDKTTRVQLCKLTGKEDSSRYKIILGGPLVSPTIPPTGINK